MIQLIRVFIEEGWKVTFATAAGESVYAADLESMGVKTATIKINCSSFDSLIKKSNPDVVLFDRFMTEEQFGWRVAEQCPDALRILDTEDLHCLRHARQRAWNAGIEFVPPMLFEEETARREIASIYRCDLSLMISEAEINILKNLFMIPANLIHYLPYLYDPLSTEQIQTLPGFEERNGFVSIGNFLHEPNRNAVLWLKDEIWPKIRQLLPDAELHIYGAYPSNKEFELHKPEDGFLIKGRAENAYDVLKKARVLLAPLRFGAGLKGKLVEAMRCGLPTVTTVIGTEGISEPTDWPGKVENDAELMAKSAVRLHRDQSLWVHSRDCGFRIINERFHSSNFRNGFVEQLYRLKSTLPLHRRENFTGAMLMHHTVASTKYMAKWIEVKNKLKGL
ncbi:MAG: glycosyltransferase [Balneolaceae bacterium]|nr:MAG: glycosyltransferase [Balneolaceae bacterium]